MIRFTAGFFIGQLFADVLTWAWHTTPACYVVLDAVGVGAVVIGILVFGSKR